MGDLLSAQNVLLVKMLSDLSDFVTTEMNCLFCHKSSENSVCADCENQKRRKICIILKTDFDTYRIGQMHSTCFNKKMNTVIANSIKRVYQNIIKEVIQKMIQTKLIYSNETQWNDANNINNFDNEIDNFIID